MEGVLADRIQRADRLKRMAAASFGGIILGLLASPADAMDFCSGPVRVTCVVDGDTVWIEGEKIRLADIDAPEAGGACEAERMIAARAAGRLAELLGGDGFLIERQGLDGYGRTLAVIVVGGGVSVGAVLVEEGLARPWAGRREQWC